jgi:hypothetical protein
VALIPGAEGIYRVPEISLPWWNLRSGKMEIATLPARELIVNAAADAIPQQQQAAPDTAAAESTTGSNRFWVWSSLLLLSALYWWLGTRRTRRARSIPAEPPSLRHARSGLQRACDNGDAAAARQALLDWGRALMEPRDIANLHALGAALGADFSAQVERLNRSLYARGGESWHGDELLNLCRRLEQEMARRKPPAPELLPLNPAG